MERATAHEPMASPGQLDATCRHDGLDRVGAPKRRNVKALAAGVSAREIGRWNLIDIRLVLPVHGWPPFGARLSRLAPPTGCRVHDEVPRPTALNAATRRGIWGNRGRSGQTARRAMGANGIDPRQKGGVGTHAARLQSGPPRSPRRRRLCGNLHRAGATDTPWRAPRPTCAVLAGGSGYGTMKWPSSLSPVSR
jgi:hypothetical protein